MVNDYLTSSPQSDSSPVTVITADSMNELYFDVIEKTHLALNPTGIQRRRDPRGDMSVELAPAVLVLTEPRARLLTLPVRNVNPFFYAAEFQWIWNGSNNAAPISYYNRRMSYYEEEDGNIHAGYGPRIFAHPIVNSDGDIETYNQFERAKGVLKTDPGSRRAVIQIWHPSDASDGWLDSACNMQLQFLAVESPETLGHKLNLNVFARSIDVYTGLPYDLYHWALLLEIMAKELGMELGSVYYYISSLHIYGRDLPHLREVYDHAIDSRTGKVFTDASHIRDADFDAAYRNLDNNVTAKIAFEQERLDNLYISEGAPFMQDVFLTHALLCYTWRQRKDKNTEAYEECLSYMPSVYQSMIRRFDERMGTRVRHSSGEPGTQAGTQ